MHVIAKKMLKSFWEGHPDSETALLRWYQIVSRTVFHTFADLRLVFPTADLVGMWVVFNIGGNKYRLITAVHFNRNKAYIRHILTHSEYDEGSWKR